jgi:hypothetical protein
MSSLSFSKGHGAWPTVATRGWSRGMETACGWKPGGKKAVPGYRTPKGRAPLSPKCINTVGRRTSDFGQRQSTKFPFCASGLASGPHPLPEVFPFLFRSGNLKGGRGLNTKRYFRADKTAARQRGQSSGGRSVKWMGGWQEALSPCSPTSVVSS